jgi:hypothetical protein
MLFNGSLVDWAVISSPRWQPFTFVTHRGTPYPRKDRPAVDPGLSLVPAMAALLLPTMSFLEARIGETGIGIFGMPPCVHCGLPTQALLFSHSGGGLQHQHLVRRDREAPNLILWGLLGSSRARCTEDATAAVKAAAITFKIFFFMDHPVFGVAF